MKKIVIIANESGGGHWQTARALTHILQQHGWTVKVINVFKELIADIDPSPKLFKMTGEEVYNRYILKNEASYLFYRLFFFCTYYCSYLPNRKTFVQRFSAFFAKEKPDIVVSVIPILNPELAISLRQTTTPFVVIQTDLFEYQEKSWFWRWFFPHGGWFASDKYAYLLTGTAKGYQQALQHQPDKNKVVQLSGNLIDSRFLQPAVLDAAKEREKLGLEADRPTGLFLYGGHPPSRVFKLVKQLDKYAIDAQFIFICGKNNELQQQLSALTTRYRKVVLGYTTEVPYYMQIADFLIGKSGPGVVMEAIAMQLPLLLDVQRVILHESENAPWVQTQDLGLTFNSVTELQQCISQLTTKAGYADFKAKVVKFENRAAFEIPQLLEQIYQQQL